MKNSWARLLASLELEGYTMHDLHRIWATLASLDPRLTENQRIKFAGHSKKVQDERYVVCEVEQLRPASEVIQIPGIGELIRKQVRTHE